MHLKGITRAQAILKLTTCDQCLNYFYSDTFDSIQDNIAIIREKIHELVSIGYIHIHFTSTNAKDRR